MSLAMTSTASAAGISQLDQWTATTTPSAAITQTTFGKAIMITGLATGQCLTLNGSNLLTTTSCGGGGSAYPFAVTGNATSTLTQFNGGLTAFASSTVGAGNLGLTVFGNATTTGTAYFAGSTGIGTSSPFARSSIHLNNGDTIRTAFAIGSSTPSATTTIFSVDNQGNVVAGGLNTNNGSISGGVFSTNAATIRWSGSTRLGVLSGDGTLALLNNAQTDFSLLQFGGTTLSFPAIKRSGAALHLRLADDSNYANLELGSITGITQINMAGSLKGRNSNNYLYMDTGTGLGIFSTGNNGSTAGVGLDYATDGTLKIRNRAFTADATLTAATSTFSGAMTGTDATNNWTGKVSPTRGFALQTGTTTQWTASTTGTAYSPFMVMPFAGTLRQVSCLTDVSFLGVNVQVNGSNATPSYFIGSTTGGTVPFIAGNTFTKGQKILANFGTTTTAATQSISCTFNVTES